MAALVDGHAGEVRFSTATPDEDGVAEPSSGVLKLLAGVGCDFDAPRRLLDDEDPSRS